MMVSEPPDEVRAKPPGSKERALAAASTMVWPSSVRMVVFPVVEVQLNDPHVHCKTLYPVQEDNN